VCNYFLSLAFSAYLAAFFFGSEDIGLMANALKSFLNNISLFYKYLDKYILYIIHSILHLNHHLDHIHYSDLILLVDLSIYVQSLIIKNIY
jgi:hypothetical protein